MEITEKLLEDLISVLKKIYGRIYNIERVCFFRGNIGLYDGEGFVIFFSKNYIVDKFNIDLGNLTKNVEDIDLLALIKQERISRVKLFGVI